VVEIEGMPGMHRHTLQFQPMHVYIHILKKIQMCCCCTADT
jgi:hypothetical protein